MKTCRNDRDCADGCIEKLEGLFSLVDTGELFTGRDAASLMRMRQDAADALHRLLVWERPLLEEAKGIVWPYRRLQQGLGFFKDHAEQKKNGFTRLQARLFLALLPFPTQWEWLLRLQDELREEPEIRAFLLQESLDIQRKIAGKPQARYKLRHFCQILKEPKGSNEKGVLRIFALPYLLVHPGLLSALSRRYVLFVEPPMGVVYRHAWWRHFSLLDDPCLFGVHADEDVDFLRGQTGVEPIQLAHGDFLEDIDWRKTNEEKIYDVVFNATFDDLPRKRHFLMLELLDHPLLIEKRVLFLGRGQHENVQEMKLQVRKMGLEGRVTILANLKRSEVPVMLSRSRMGVHLSLYENACRSIFEFFRSNLPCVASSSMGGMNLRIFNDRTGLAVPDRELPQAIAFVSAYPDAYEPRRWFLESSGSSNSTEKLNRVLRHFFEQRGYSWTEDIVPLGSSGATRYVDPSDYERFRAEFEWLLKCFEKRGDRSMSFHIE